MPRLSVIAFACLFLFGADASAPVCDFSGIPTDQLGCMDLKNFIATDSCVIKTPVCFNLRYLDVAPKKVYFKDNPERERIVSILDVSAEALAKNRKLQQIDIVLFDRGGKFSKNFQEEAESYLLDKGIKKSRFRVKIIHSIK